MIIVGWLVVGCFNSFKSTSVIMVSSPTDLTSDLPGKLSYAVHLQIQSAGVGWDSEGEGQWS